ncbi:hypothetical protein [Paraburkholderia fungorum]|uniref:hypothetical protein n=1 Tax=Paraburkholderia fungorum TaxID=134537 RepID=UPI0038BB3775
MASPYTNAFPIAHAGAYATPQAGAYATPQAGVYATPQMGTAGISGLGGAQPIAAGTAYSPAISDPEAFLEYMNSKYGRGLWLPSGAQFSQEN